MRNPARVRSWIVLSVLGCLVLAGSPAGAAGPDDPFYTAGIQWGLEKIEAERAWSVSRGRGAVVAVIDTGIDPDHPDLKGRILPGRDFVDDPAGEPDATDRNGHGTLISGIIAAATDNGRGVASTAPLAKVLPVRVLDENGEGTSSIVARGIDWAVDQGADVVNLSLARDGSDDGGLFLPELLLRDPAVDEAIKDAAAAGAIVVVAAGNDSEGGEDETSYDATTPGVMVVGSSTKRDNRAAHSNYGDGLDLLAPGGGSSTDPSESGCTESNSIVSTWWNPEDETSTYGGGCGTSMAVAFVSGVAALLATEGLDNAAIVDRILGTTDDLGPPGRDQQTGHGRLNARRALGVGPARAPQEPPARRDPPRRSDGPVIAQGSPDPAVEPPARDEPDDDARQPRDEPGSVRAAPKEPERGTRPVTAAAFLITLVVLGHSWRIVATTRR